MTQERLAHHEHQWYGRNAPADPAQSGCGDSVAPGTPLVGGADPHASRRDDRARVRCRVASASDGKDEEAVLSGLDELWQRRIIREYDGPCYDFSHDRIRDVAYAMIGPVKRRCSMAGGQAWNAFTGRTPILLLKNWLYTANGRVQTGVGLLGKPPRQLSAFTCMPKWSRICGRLSRSCRCCRLRRRTERRRSICGMTLAWPKFWCMTGAASRSARPGTGPTSWQCKPIAHSCVAALRLQCGLFTVTGGNGAMASSFPSLR